MITIGQKLKFVGEPTNQMEERTDYIIIDRVNPDGRYGFTRYSKKGSEVGITLGEIDNEKYELIEEPKPEKDEVDLIIDEFLDGPYFNEMWEDQYGLLRYKVKLLLKSERQKIREMVKKLMIPKNMKLISSDMDPTRAVNVVLRYIVKELDADK